MRKTKLLTPLEEEEGGEGVQGGGGLPLLFAEKKNQAQAWGLVGTPTHILIPVTRSDHF